MAASLTRTVGFRALHRLYRSDWSEARNREVFGPVADATGHGHDYQCAVTVQGRLDEAGMMLDLSLLDRTGLVLERVRIMEDPTLYADCTGTD